jgi:FecR-like protein
MQPQVWRESFTRATSLVELHYFSKTIFPFYIFRRRIRVQGHPFVIRLTLIIPLSLLVIIGARAQNKSVQATIRSHTGDASLYPTPNSARIAIKQDMQLEPDNMIVTGPNGRVIIGITDGSRITVMPNSTVILKKFQVPNPARELLEIKHGKVIVKIRHEPGRPNPYNLSSPAASIAVRGTAFTVDVQLGGETLVLVHEGLVEVWPRDNPDNKRLVSPGDRVTIQPGGRISSVFPTPNRSLESVTQKTGGDSGIFFSAFPDRHLDSLDNPAYATEFKDAQGRLLLLPSVSSPNHVENASANGAHSNSKGLPPFNYDVSPQVTFFTPIPDTRFVIGGGISAAHTRRLRVVNVEYTEYMSHENNARKLNALNASIIAAYSFGEQGRTSVGIGIDRSSGKENLSVDYDSKSTTSESMGFNHSRAYIARTSITLGLTRRLSESMKIGFYYRHSFNLSDQLSLVQRDYSRAESSYPDFVTGAPVTIPAYSYFGAAEGDISATSSSSELGFRLRGSLTRKLFYGTQGSFIYERIRSRERIEAQIESGVQVAGQPVAYNRYLGRSGNLGAGLGFLLTSRILLNFDLVGSLFNTPRPMSQPLILGLSSVNYPYPSFALASALYSPDSLRVRGWNVSTHMAGQVNPWRNLILSTSVLKTYQKYNYSTMAVSIGTGWKFKPNLIAEYVTSAQYGDQGPSHAIRLRYTFNLGITNEK